MAISELALQRVRRRKKARRLYKKAPLFALAEVNQTTALPYTSLDEFWNDLPIKTKPKRQRLKKSPLVRYGRYAEMKRLLSTLQVDMQRLVDRSEPIKAQPIQTPPPATKQPDQPDWVKTLGLDGAKKLTFATVTKAYSQRSMQATTQKQRDALVKAYEQAARHFKKAI